MKRYIKAFIIIVCINCIVMMALGFYWVTSDIGIKRTRAAAANTEIEDKPEQEPEQEQEQEPKPKAEPTLTELNGYREFIATAYCGCAECNGQYSDGETAVGATGAALTSRCSIAADFSVLPPFTQVEISGMGIYTVHDCGAAIKGNRIDIYFDNHEDAEAFGRQKVRLRVCDD